MSKLARQVYAAAHDIDVENIVEDDDEHVAIIDTILESRNTIYSVGYIGRDCDNYGTYSPGDDWTWDRDRVQAEVLRLNRIIANKRNAEMFARRTAALKHAEEWQVLVDAGLRKGPCPVWTPTEADCIKHTAEEPGGGEYNYVAEIEIES